MLALCHDLKAADYDQNYAGIIFSSLDNNAVTIIPTELGAWIDAGLFCLSVSFLLQREMFLDSTVGASRLLKYVYCLVSRTSGFKCCSPM